MNNKRFFLTSLLSAAVLFCSGQLIQNKSRFDITLHGGGTLGSYFGGDISDNLPVAGYYYGARLTYYLSTWVGVETGYGYNRLGTTEKNDYLNIENKAAYHQVPVLLRMKGKRLSLGLGLELNILENAELHYNNVRFSENVTHLYRTTYNAGCADLTIKLSDISSAGLSFSYGLEPLLKKDFDWTGGVVRVFYGLRVY